jgi:hypothetical protein
VEGVWQLTQQFPSAFEFNSQLLIALLDNFYACLFGTFLYNCEKERKEANLAANTLSFWNYVNHNLKAFTNPNYVAHSSVLRAQVDKASMQLWKEYYVRWNTPKELPLLTGTFLIVIFGDQ